MSKTMPSVADDFYATRAAAGMVHSMEYYGNSSPAVGDGIVSTPAYYANMLGNVLIARGDSLPGEASEWYGTRYLAYARDILSEYAVRMVRQAI